MSRLFFFSLSSFRRNIDSGCSRYKGSLKRFCIAQTTKSTVKEKKIVSAFNGALSINLSRGKALSYRAGIWRHLIGKYATGALLCTNLRIRNISGIILTSIKSPDDRDIDISHIGIRALHLHSIASLRNNQHDNVTRKCIPTYDSNFKSTFSIR